MQRGEVVIEKAEFCQFYANSPEDGKKVKRKAKEPIKKNVTFEVDVKSSSPLLKRPQKLIRASSAVEPLAPPKKIRRTKHDRFRPKIFFKNAHLEQLFYHWLKEQNGVSFDITAIGNQQNVIEILAANSADDILPAEEFQKMLEDAINKLEDEQDAIVLIKNAMDDEQVLEKSVIELELPLNITNKESGSDGNENLDLSSITKTTSMDSQMDLNAQDVVQPLRKRKSRRCLSLRRNNSMSETATQCGTTIITTTDSDSDAKAEKLQTQQQPQPQSCTLPKSSKCSNYVKKLIFKDQQQNLTICSNELSIVELDGSWMRKVNSPSKIKNAYTLTVISSPSPATGSGSSEDDLPTQKSSRSWPSLTEAEIIDKERRLKDESDNTKQQTMECKLAQEKLKVLMDNFIDQGFETGSNDMESPMKLNRKPSNPQNYSTPNKTQSLQQNFNANDSTLSPIRHNNPRRQPSNLNMTVIQEHNSCQDLEKSDKSATFLIEQQTATYTIPSCSQFWITWNLQLL
ncbi:hypothetical protein DOY81_009820 [Sarcophaga bullata]|nr:hypothetical protein DOY81_009820 [Sarcophaga bullata]